MLLRTIPLDQISNSLCSEKIPTVKIQPSAGLFDLDLDALWHYRELLYFLVWRDVKVRYKQTVIGIGWAVFQPLMTMVIFTTVFSYFAKMPSDGLPYPLFSYTALLPWTFVSQAISRSGTSLVGEAQLIRKVYFPRIIMPLAASVTPAVDFLVALFLLPLLMAWFGITFGWQIILFPVFLLVALLTALAVSLWLSALNVRYRDVGHAIPFFIQLWMFASPVLYPLSVIPDHWLAIYSLNPMVGVIEGFRWALLGQTSATVEIVLPSVLIVFVLLLGGIVYFKRMERIFADVI